MAGPRRTNPQADYSMPEITRIGRMVADRRITLRLTQQTLADLAGVSRSTVQAMERGSGAVKFASLMEIVAALGLRIDVSVDA